MARILLTGATGFLGRYLCDHFRRSGHEVFGTSSNPMVNSPIFCCDIGDKQAIEFVFRQTQPEVVIHCAAISSVTSSASLDYYKVNTVGTENIINAALGMPNRVRLVLISTAGVYGNQEIDHLHEDLCPKPVHHYGMSKLCAERVLVNHADALDYTIIRPFNIIGAGQSGDFIMPKLVNAFHKRASVVRLGNIDVFRDYIDVSDACELIARLSFNPSAVGEISNLCTGRPVSIKALLEILQRITGHQIQAKVDPAFVRKNEVWRLLGDVRKLEELTDGPIGGVQLEQSLRNMLAAKSQI